jgi:hypothetical protein
LLLERISCNFAEGVNGNSDAVRIKFSVLYISNHFGLIIISTPLFNNIMNQINEIVVPNQPIYPNNLNFKIGISLGLEGFKPRSPTVH